LQRDAEEFMVLALAKEAGFRRKEALAQVSVTPGGLFKFGRTP